MSRPNDLSMKYVLIQKIAASELAECPPAAWENFRPGAPTPVGVSLPVDYTLEGWLLEDPRVGSCVRVLRRTRNGVPAAGIYTSSEVTAVNPDGYVTLNSIYQMRETATELPPPQLQFEGPAEGVTHVPCAAAGTKQALAKLEALGRTLVDDLVAANSDQFCDAAAVAERFAIATRDLHVALKDNRVIVFSRSSNAKVLFPIVQFARGQIQTWAAEIIATVGNGDPAVHLLFVPRGSLDGRTLADAILDSGGRQLPHHSGIGVDPKRQ